MTEAVNNIPIPPGTPLFGSDGRPIIEYSKYEVMLLGWRDTTVFVSSLLVRDEMEILSMTTLSESKLFEQICKLVFSKISGEDRVRLWNNDFNQFMKTCTIADRDALLLGILLATYEDNFESELACSKCGEKNKITLDLAKCAKITPYPLPPSIDKAVDINFTISLKRFPLVLDMKVPSLHDFKKILNYVDKTYGPSGSDAKRRSFTALLFPILVALRELKLMDPRDGSVKVSLDTSNNYHINDIVGIVNSMPNSARKELQTQLAQHLKEDIGVELSFLYECSSCGNQEQMKLTALDFFFLVM